MADLHSQILDAPPGLNSFNFIEFLRNLAKSCVWGPPGRLASPPRGTPGSATDNYAVCFQIHLPPLISRSRPQLAHFFSMCVCVP